MGLFRPVAGQLYFTLLYFYHTGITVCGVISWFPPYHGHCKWHRMSLTVHFWWTGSATHVWCPFLVLVTYFTTKIQGIRILLYLQLTHTFLKQMSLLRIHNKIYLDCSHIYGIFKRFNVTRQKWWHKETVISSNSLLKQFLAQFREH